MAEKSISFISADELLDFEQLTYQMLKELLQSRPHGLPFREYQGPIRIMAKYNQKGVDGSDEKRRLRFTVDFPQIFESTLKEKPSPDYDLKYYRHQPDGIGLYDFAELIGSKVSQLLLVRDLPICHQASYGAGNGGGISVWWFRL